MRSMLWSVVFLGPIVLAGCSRYVDHVTDGRHHSDAIDFVFKRRHGEPAVQAHDPVIDLSRQLTRIEDDLRRDGTITIKSPDVWGDGNLMYFLQEFDNLLADRTKGFTETLQAYIARSDRGELQSTTGLAAALGKDDGTPETPTPEPVKDEATSLWELIANNKAAPGPAQTAVGVEPTEVARQHATFIDVCQAIRRRHMGDDNCRAAGYGLYKFRIPVSVLPGRETAQGHFAVVTLRARLQVDEANLTYTFPKLVVADLVDQLTPILRAEEVSQGNAGHTSRTLEKKGPLGAPPIGPSLSPTDAKNVFGSDTVSAIRAIARNQVSPNGDTPLDEVPELEVRAALFRVLAQVASILEEDDALAFGDQDCGNYAHTAADALQHGRLDLCARTKWIEKANENAKTQFSPKSWPEIGWAVALQSAILDINLKRIYRELQVRKAVSEADVLSVDEIFFFVRAHRSVAARYWQTIVRESFPLSVFAIDPQVEEQNAYDAFSRRREMQLALAYNVAKGRFGMSQKLALSRQLGLDQATIALNRTVVGFSHGNDTFGWYFYPRVQSPPTEQTNLGAVARMVWATGPTEHYDLKHRKLEPGMRECEVLIAMPSFVTEVAFDVTTNWESVACPGVTKRSYEEMLVQGSRIERLKECLRPLCGKKCYRPGDVERLLSRIDQLEEMLGMQTYCVRVPYEYEQSGHDLFDKGNVRLRPVLAGYYGLEYLQTGDAVEASLFLTGNNFHPTLTHVIIGGRESHSLSETTGVRADVEVINRQLLRVKTGKLNEKLSPKDSFQVRVGTPSGLSNPLRVNAADQDKPKETPKGWSFAEPASLRAVLYDVCATGANGTRTFNFVGSDPTIKITYDLDEPLPSDMNGQFIGQLTATSKDDKPILFGNNKKKSLATTTPIPLKHGGKNWTVPWDDLGKAIKALIEGDSPGVNKESFTITLTGYVAFDKFPVSKTLNTIEILVEPCASGKHCEANGWLFADPVSVQAILYDTCATDPSRSQRLRFLSVPEHFKVTQSPGAAPSCAIKGQLTGQLTATTEDGTPILFGSRNERSLDIASPIPLKYDNKAWTFSSETLRKEIQTLLQNAPPATDRKPFTMTLTGYAVFDKSPPSKMLNTIEIQAIRCKCEKTSTEKEKPATGAQLMECAPLKDDAPSAPGISPILDKTRSASPAGSKSTVLELIPVPEPTGRAKPGG